MYERNEAAGGIGSAKNVISRLARSEPQASQTTSSGDTPENRARVRAEERSRTSTLKGGWGGRVAANEVQTEPLNKSN